MENQEIVCTLKRCILQLKSHLSGPYLPFCLFLNTEVAAEPPFHRGQLQNFLSSASDSTAHEQFFHQGEKGAFSVSASVRKNL
jgi:hypothetical protein